MKKYGQLLKRMLYPKTGWVIAVTLCSAVGLAAVFLQGWEETPAAYCIYALSAYSLTVLVLKTLPLWGAGRARLKRNPLYHRYSTDPVYKTRVSLSLSLAVTALYCVAKAAAAALYRSPWLACMAGYYLVLCAVRCLLLRPTGETLQHAWRKYRACGGLLFVLTAALGSLTFYILFAGATLHYPGFMIYAAAAFTFYNLTMAIYNLIRYRRMQDPVVSAGKMLALAVAAVSMFFLQTAMFSAFGDGGSWQMGMNRATGTAVFLLIAGMALYMLRRSTAALKAAKGEGA